MIAKLAACRRALDGGVPTSPSWPGAASRSSRRGRARESKGTSRASAPSDRKPELRERDERMTTVTDVIAIEKDHLLQVYRRGSVVFDRGRGCRLFDTNGRSYLDLISGVGVAALGHAHPRLAAAIAAQAQRTAAYVEPVLPSAPGRARRRACRRSRGCRARSSATAAPKRSRRA